MGKGEIACSKQFLLYPKSFLPIWRIFCSLHQIWNCGLQTLPIWKGLKFVIWGRANPFPNKPWFYVSAIQVFWKHCRKRRTCSKQAISPFLTVFSIHLENFLQLFIIFKIAICKFVQFGSIKCVIQESVKTIPSFSRLKEKDFWKIGRKGGNAYNQHFLPFSRFLLCYNQITSIVPHLKPSPIAQSVVLWTLEQEVGGSIPGSANILSEDWWSLRQDSFLSHRCPLFRQWLFGKAASGLERLCEVLFKRTPEKHG